MVSTTFTDGSTVILSAWLNDVNAGTYTFNYNNILTGWGNNAYAPCRYGGTGYGGATPYTSGQLLIGNSSNTLTAATLTAGSGISVNNGSGSITISATGAAAENVYIKTSTYTAVDHDIIFANTTSGAFTINLPASPVMGSQVQIIDGAGTFATNTLTVGHNGNNLMGLAQDMTVKINNAAFSLRYEDSTTGWRIR